MKLLFTGDVCFNYQPELEETMAQTALADMLPLFRQADYRVMNLETPLCPEHIGAPIEKSGPNLVGRPRNIAFLTTAGCDCAILANNHTGDYGDDALYATLDLLDSRGIAHTGAGANLDEAYRPWRIAKDGVSVSVIAVCENEFGIATAEKPGAAGFSWEWLGDRIRMERMVSRYVIVVFHGGAEHYPLPTPLTRERYRTIIRLGADAVIGGHPHTMQGYELYDGKPIYYSMGNFFFQYVPRQDASWYRGYMVMLNLTASGVSGEVIPYTADPDTMRLTPVTGQGYKNTIVYLEKLSAYIGNTTELKRLYEGWCTMSGFGYSRSLMLDPAYMTVTDTPAPIAPLKNLFGCEAHNELMRTTLDLAFFGDLAKAAEAREEIRRLQEMPEIDR